MNRTDLKINIRLWRLASWWEYFWKIAIFLYKLQWHP